MILLKVLLFPFSILYDLVTTIRNKFYDWKIFTSHTFNVSLINVGNLTVGGTGKSPVVEYLIRLLNEEREICTLSRGYGRKTKGFLFADHQSTAEQIGDEPLQFYRKYSDQIRVAVGENRADAISQILKSRPDTNLILLDDAYQHRAVSPDLNILITDYNRLFYKDMLLPGGRLRESAIGAHRADVVLVSKCPASIDPEYKNTIIKNIHSKAGKTLPVFFTTIDYSAPVAINEGNSKIIKGQKVITFTGIAKPTLFFDHLAGNCEIVKKITFPDHHNYSSKDLEAIFNNGIKYGKDVAYVTTEKDMVRLLKEEFRSMIKDKDVFYIPIRIKFLEKEEEFNQIIKKAINL